MSETAKKWWEPGGDAEVLKAALELMYRESKDDHILLPAEWFPDYSSKNYLEVPASQKLDPDSSNPVGLEKWMKRRGKS